MIKLVEILIISFTVSNPFNSLLVNVFSVNNCEHPDFIPLNFANYSVIVLGMLRGFYPERNTSFFSVTPTSRHLCYLDKKQLLIKNTHPSDTFHLNIAHFEPCNGKS